MIAVAILGFVLAIPTIMTPVVTLFVLFVLAFLLAVSVAIFCCRRPRVRLAIESFILLVFLLLAASERESHFYTEQANRTSELASEAFESAAMSSSPKDRAILLRESAWFARRSRTLRWRAMWKGLLHGPDYPAGNRQELIRVIDLMWDIQRHEDAAKKAGMFAVPGE